MLQWLVERESLLEPDTGIVAVRTNDIAMMTWIWEHGQDETHFNQQRYF